MGRNDLPSAGGGQVELQSAYSDLPCRFPKPFHISSVWSTEFYRFQQQSSCTLFTLLLMVGIPQCTMNFLSEYFPSPYDINSRYFSIYLQFQIKLPSSPKDINAKNVVSRSTAISTFQCSAASFLPIPHLSVSHTTYFKLIKTINFICFKLQIHTNICVCKTYILYIYTYTQIQRKSNSFPVHHSSLFCPCIPISRKSLRLR